MSVAVRTAAGRPAVLFYTGEMVVNRPRTEPEARSAAMQQNSNTTDPMATRAAEVECKLGLVELRRLQAEPGARPIWWDDDEVNWAEATTEQDAAVPPIAGMQVSTSSAASSSAQDLLWGLAGNHDNDGDDDGDDSDDDGQWIHCTFHESVSSHAFRIVLNT